MFWHDVATAQGAATTAPCAGVAVLDVLASAKPVDRPSVW
jgi:hypothetical protein